MIEKEFHSGDYDRGKQDTTIVSAI